MERSSVDMRLDVLDMVADDLACTYIEKRVANGQAEELAEKMGLLDAAIDLLHKAAHLAAQSGNFRTKESFKKGVHASLESWLDHAASDLEDAGPSPTVN